ncbi:MAG: hypothetical protein AAF363_11000 [Bacteroidota bacterium]
MQELEGAAVAHKEITVDEVESILAENGYEVTEHELGEGASVLRIQDPESGVVVRGVLEGEVLFLTLSCVSVPQERVTPELMSQMLASDNGISTSSFQLYSKPDGTVAITLNNFCKLQELGADDCDDILSCVEFLMADVIAARELVGDLR